MSGVAHDLNRLAKNQFRIEAGQFEINRESPAPGAGDLLETLARPVGLVKIENSARKFLVEFFHRAWIIVWPISQRDWWRMIQCRWQ